MDTSEERLRRRHRVATSVSMFVLGIIFASWASRIPDIQARLALSDAALGMVLFAMPLGQFPSMAVAPKLIARFGARRVVLASLAAFAFSLILLGLAPSTPVLIVTMLGFGAMNSLLNISNNTQAVAIEKAYARSIMSSFHGFWSLGGVVGGFIGGLAASFDLTPFSHFVGIAFLCWGLGLAIRRRLRPDDSVSQVEADVPSRTPSRHLLFDPFLLLCGFVGFLCMFTEGVMYDWNAVYFVSVLGAEGLSARMGYLASMIAMVTGRFLADDLINRYGREKVLLLSSTSMTLGLVGLAMADTLPLATMSSAFVGFGMASVVPIVYSLAGQNSRASAQASISWVSAISFWGFVMGPPLIGMMSEAWGLANAFKVVVLLPFLVGVLAKPLMLVTRRGCRKMTKHSSLA